MKTNNHSQSICDDSTSSEISDILDDNADYLDEAEAYNNSGGPTPPKQGKVTSPVSVVNSRASLVSHFLFVLDQ